MHEHGGKVIVEHPVNHGKGSQWPIKGRENHSTLFETDIFNNFTKDVPGERVYSDLCMTGTATRKTTQWYCNMKALPAATKYLGVLQCSEEDTPEHPYPHTGSLVGKDEKGEWRSKNSGQYTTICSGLLAQSLLED